MKRVKKSVGRGWRCIDVSDVVIAGLVGGAAGFVAPFAAPGAVGAVGLGGIASVAQVGASNYFNGDDTSAGEVLSAAAFGGAAGAIGGGAGRSPSGKGRAYTILLPSQLRSHVGGLDGKAFTLKGYLVDERCLYDSLEAYREWQQFVHDPNSDKENIASYRDYRISIIRTQKEPISAVYDNYGRRLVSGVYKLDYPMSLENHGRCSSDVLVVGEVSDQSPQVPSVFQADEEIPN